ncbi:excisionase family protein [Massilia sp. DWR3-1-1]|uniref:excisionase family protein n=1 Tax=Massilia sp. DWR3-1-1 TaxID=2804559 RepID=UPI003CEF0F59
MDPDDVDMVAKLVVTIEKNARKAVAQAAAKTHPLTWVKLERYVELSGDSVDAVQSRRRIGKWIDGKQCKIVDGRLWINIPAVEEWIEKWDQKRPARAALNYGREP